MSHRPEPEIAGRSLEHVEATDDERRVKEHGERRRE